MIVVAHRRNGLDELAATPRTLGVEADVRERGGRLVVTHDPFTTGPDLEAWLDRYQHALLALHLKEEGLAEHVLPLLRARGVDDFFLLGPPLGEQLPFLDAGEGRFAVRVSEVHHPATAHGLAGRVRWIWLDAFRGGLPVRPEALAALADDGFRICLASPELYGRDPAGIPAFREAVARAGVTPAAVCTRHPGAWGG